MRPAARWVKAQPDRPFVILLAHILVVLLYATHRAVSPVPFKGQASHYLVASPLLQILHGTGIVLLVIAIARKHGMKGVASIYSLSCWAFTTAVLYLAAEDRNPPLALWAAALSLVITLAALLMAARWGVDGDGDENGVA